MKLQRLTRQGFTLMEVLIVMGLLSVLLMILATVFAAAVDIQSQSQSYSAVHSEMRSVMSRLNYDIARATSITTPATAGANATSLVMVIGGNTHTYAVVGGRLQLTNSSGTDFLTSTDITVTTIVFVRLGNAGGKESIRYGIGMQSVATDLVGPEVQTLSSTVERR